VRQQRAEDRKIDQVVAEEKEATKQAEIKQEIKEKLKDKQTTSKPDPIGSIAMWVGIAIALVAVIWILSKTFKIF